MGEKVELLKAVYGFVGDLSSLKNEEVFLMASFICAFLFYFSRVYNLLCGVYFREMIVAYIFTLRHLV